MSSSITLRISLDSCSQILVYPCESISECMADSLSVFLWLRCPPPSLMKAIFFFPPTLTAGVCSSPATLQLRPALCIDHRHWESPFQCLSLLSIYLPHGATLHFLQWFLTINPVILHPASSLGYIKSNLFRDEKLNIIVQMSSCPPRGIVMYTQLVVGFNCDIYEMWESEACAPFLLCQRGFFSPRESESSLIAGRTSESICQVVFSLAAN